MFRFETLDIWKMAIDYSDKVYDIVEKFPQSTQYSLGSQLRASALSISNNIAEGSGSNSNLEFKSFLTELRISNSRRFYSMQRRSGASNYSIRSTFETVSGLIFAQRRKLLSDDQFNQLYKDGELLVKKNQSFHKSL